MDTDYKQKVEADSVFHLQIVSVLVAQGDREGTHILSLSGQVQIHLAKWNNPRQGCTQSARTNTVIQTDTHKAHSACIIKRLNTQNGWVNINYVKFKVSEINVSNDSITETELAEQEEFSFWITT